MEQKIKELKQSFRKARARDIDRIDGEMEKLSREDPDAFSEAMLKALGESAREAGEPSIREQL